MTFINHEALPDWAIEEALKPVNTSCSEICALSVARVRYYKYIAITLRQSILAHAQMIFKYQKEPVDPLLEEAREICAKDAERLRYPSSAEGYRAGDHDDSPIVQVILTALRRGVEIGKGGPGHDRYRKAGDAADT